MVQKRILFRVFPYVCPEPVLVKRSFLYINGSKRPFLLTCLDRRCVKVAVDDVVAWRLQQEKDTFWINSLGLSRACLDKMIIYV